MRSTWAPVEQTAAGGPAQAVMVQRRLKNAGTVARYTKAISAGTALQWL